MTSPHDSAQRLLQLVDSDPDLFTPSELADIHAVCEALQSAPRWQPKPSAPGRWLYRWNNGPRRADSTHMVDQHHVDTWGQFGCDVAKVFGPIPEPSQEGGE
jgi:hypothetical protein